MVFPLKPPFSYGFHVTMSACRHIDLATLPRFGQQVVAATATIRLVHDETLDPGRFGKCFAWMLGRSWEDVVENSGKLVQSSCGWDTQFIVNLLFFFKINNDDNNSNNNNIF